jgi:hypothetical protein
LRGEGREGEEGRERKGVITRKCLNDFYIASRQSSLGGRIVPMVCVSRERNEERRTKERKNEKERETRKRKNEKTRKRKNEKAKKRESEKTRKPESEKRKL